MSLYPARFPVDRQSFRPHYSSSGVFTSNPVSGYTPNQLISAYGYKGALDASGMKIAVICAFNNLELEADLSAFCNTFSLTPPKISVFYSGQRAQTTTEQWITESSLDVQWASVFAPGAEIYAVFAENAQTDSMLTAVEYARSLNPHVISMSFGTEEGTDLMSKNSVFENGGCIFVSSSGDTGGVVSFPSSSPHVLSVGGSTLAVSSDYTPLSQGVWRMSGGGSSDIFDMPLFQSRFQPMPSTSGTKRATPDVAFFADSSKGAAVYVSSRGGWTTVGGTSLACACVSGICACIARSSPSVMSDGILQYLYDAAGRTAYSQPQYSFFDIVSGTNGVFYAEKGWDFCSGLGVPKARII